MERVAKIVMYIVFWSGMMIAIMAVTFKVQEITDCICRMPAAHEQ